MLKKLAGKKIVWIVSGILPLALFAVWMLLLFTEQQEEAISQLMNEAAGNAAHTLERTLGEQIGILDGLATARSLDTGDFALFHISAARLKARHPEWRTVILTDARNQLFNLRSPPGQPLDPPRDPKSLEKVWQTKEAYIGDLSFGHVAIRVPVIRDNHVLYTLVAPVDPQFFLSVLRTAKERNGRQYIIAGSDDIVIAASPETGMVSGKPLLRHFIDHKDDRVHQEEGMLHARPVRVPASGWRLFLLTSADAVKAPFARTRLIVFAGGVIASVLTVVLTLALGAAWIARHETERLRLQIDERKRVQETLQHSEMALKEAQSLAEVGSWSWDIGTGIHIWSEEVYHIYGRDPGLPPAVYPEVQQYFTAESWERLSAAVQEGLAAGRAYTCDAEVVRPDGGHRWITARGIAEHDSEGKVRRLKGTVQDITGRKRMEDSLRESELKFRTLFEQSMDAIAIMDGYPPRFRIVNPAFVEMSGYSSAEVAAMEGDEVWKLVHPEDIDHVKKSLKERMDGRSASARYEMRIVRKDGSIRWVEAIGTRIEIGGKVINQAYYRDISERKRAEFEQQKLQEQLLQAQKMESVGRLAGGVAHDFNNILSVIIGHAEMAMAELDPASHLHADLQAIYEAAQRSTGIIRQLLTFSRKQIVVPVILDLNPMVEGMLKMLRRLIGEDIELFWQPAGDRLTIRIDPTQLDQVLANLCVNARDAIADTGRISIETRRVRLDEEYCSGLDDFSPGEYAILAVSDSGCGMDKDLAEKIFEPFFSTKGDRGTGLGLSTVYGIVRQNHGSIHVYSEPGEGTTFRIYLPLVEDQGLPEMETKPEVIRAGAGEVILIVEDDPGILKMGTTMLERLGYAVLTAATPQEGIEMARTHTGGIDILLTDVIMPQMNGKQLAHEILGIHPGLRVIYMSGYTANVIAHHGVLDEGIHFLQKPFTKKDLKAKISEVLG